MHQFPELIPPLPKSSWEPQEATLAAQGWGQTIYSGSFSWCPRGDS